ncbi:cytochrome P450 [Mycena pura]|uniref:Cytochrome P450 n=1 Tax=Mycena pura TaxID=153505 RepID=A0AAD6V8P6_9AGAR|nr:cytochrome P450 [Mycena pura]
MSFYISWALFTILLLLLRYGSRRSRLPLPPGPRRLPLIGNLLHMPVSFPWETFMKWSQAYNSDIIYLNVAGTSIIVLSSLEATNELLGERSNIYSDRARMPMVNELMGWTFHLAGMKYGEHWRELRRKVHQDLNAEAVRKYYPQERVAVHELLHRLLHHPDNFFYHLRHVVGKVIMSVTYGIRILPEDDPYVKLAEDAIHTLSDAATPGRFLVDFIPTLVYIPEWFPGAGFKRTAKEWRKLAQAMINSPFAETQRMIVAGTAPPSFVSTHLGNISDSDDLVEEERQVKEAAGTMYAAGADTIVSALNTFVLAMLSNRKAQKTAQNEIDSVIGNGRLPDFTDEESLPYLTALVKEVFRWKPVTPIAIPHFLHVEDEYRGYRLPAQSIVIPNTWAISHDATMYPDPYEFKPERWLLNGQLNPAMRGSETVFGYGRRICAGMHLATSSVCLTIASILATMDITKAVDNDGTVIEPTHEYESALVMLPLPFKCSFKPRSEEAKRLIEETIHTDDNLY